MPRRVHVVALLLASVVLAWCLAACWLTSSFDGLVDAGSPISVAEGGGDATAKDAPSDAGPVDAVAEAEGEAQAQPDAGCLANDYVSSVVADNPQSYWRLDEDAGTTASDFVRNHDGIYRGGVTLGVPGILPNDSAARFQGEGQGDGGYVSVGTYLAFLGKAPFSVEAWIQPSRIDTAYRGVLSNESTSIGSRFGYLMYVSVQPDAGVLSGFERWNGGMSNPTVVVNAVAQNEWAHVVGTFDTTGTETFYVNGAAVSIDQGPAIDIGQSGSFVIGALNSAATPTFFVGTIDEVAVYDHALSARCVLAHYHLGTGKAP